ncbi:D-sedoheptulose 7-phosphate isomerase [Arcobacter roscoffensis]|uniref:Phosphoheptose isomerase n=1 Tax=Arcobacter roscoffensis TaxID=2961520 RepID=A0ABY5E6H8_9BACT|nr:D-sedoheptulose 7-phosphate isomerase [Arcobacter roscoffensis]UTJ07350.1 D-sedoheptulose 7-phosphate isomerase [Arcobacter roscoffensis]
MIKTISQELQNHLSIVNSVINSMEDQLNETSKLILDTLKNGNKILICGNGGSAADAQHIASELTGRYKTNRKALPCIALTTDTSALTSIGNDYGYEKVFARQVEALVNEGDLFIGISTSGNSQNIITALKTAKDLGCNTLGLSGNDGGEMDELCDLNLIVPSSNTPRIQEMHILFGHIFCQLIDDEFTN